MKTLHVTRNTQFKSTDPNGMIQLLSVCSSVSCVAHTSCDAIQLQVFWQSLEQGLVHHTLLLMRNFYGCYLLRSLDPAARIKTYIGFTVNPKRRIRQHNGEISSGAWRTRRGRPWEMVLVVYGFPTQVHALQFEWAWQHPKKSKVARDVLADIKTSHRTGLQGKVRLLLGMLQAPPWRYYPLTLQFLVEEHSTLPRGCPDFSPNLDVHVGPLDTLPSCLQDDEGEDAAAAAAAATGSEGDVDSVGDGLGSERSEASDGDGGSSSDAEASHSSSSSSSSRRRRRPLDSSGGSSGVEVLSDDTESKLQQLQPLAARLRAAAAASHAPVAAAAAAVAAAAAAAATDNKPAATAAAAGGGKRKPRVRSRSGDAAGGESSVHSTGCGCCSQALHAFVLPCPSCGAEYHTQCLAQAFNDQQQQQQQQQQTNPAAERLLASATDPAPPSDSSTSRVLQRRHLPQQGNCPCCGAQLVWLEALAATKRFGGSDGSSGAQGGRKQRTRQRKKAASNAADQPAEASKSRSRHEGAASTKPAAAAAVKPGTGQRKATGGRAGARGHVVAAAGASLAASDGLAPVTAMQQDGQQQQQQHLQTSAAPSALADLLHHLQQQYPGLEFPSDPAALQQLLLRDEAGGLQPGSGDTIGPRAQQRGDAAQWGQPSPSAAAAADAMDLCSSVTASGSEGQACGNKQEQPVHHRGQRQSQAFDEWLQEHLPEPQQQHEQQQVGQQDGQLASPVDLTSSPEPLLRRLNLASPSKGKRSRPTHGGSRRPAGTPAAAAAATGSTGAVAVHTSSGNGSSGDDGSGSSGSRGMGRPVLRCRPNGSTPAAMIVKSRPTQLGAAAAAAAVAAAEQGVTQAGLHREQELEAICLLDSD